MYVCTCVRLLTPCNAQRKLTQEYSAITHPFLIEQQTRLPSFLNYMQQQQQWHQTRRRVLHIIIIIIVAIAMKYSWGSARVVHFL